VTKLIKEDPYIRILFLSYYKFVLSYTAKNAKMRRDFDVI
jgi:hypothetical protein